MTNIAFLVYAACLLHGLTTLSGSDSPSPLVDTMSHTQPSAGVLILGSSCFLVNSSYTYCGIVQVFVPVVHSSASNEPLCKAEKASAS